MYNPSIDIQIKALLQAYKRGEIPLDDLIEAIKKLFKN